MKSNSQQFEEEFSEAYENWEIEKLYTDLGRLSPSARKYLRGVLCCYSPKKISNQLGYRGKDPSYTVRKLLNQEVYPAVRQLLDLEQEKKIDWSKIPKLLESYTKQQSTASPDIQIDGGVKCARKCWRSSNKTNKFGEKLLKWGLKLKSMFHWD